MKRHLLPVALLFAFAAVASASPAWTSDNYDPSTWTPSSQNGLKNLTPEFTGSMYHENGAQPTDPAALCDGVVLVGDNRFSSIFGIRDGAAVSWTLPTPSKITAIRLFSLWPDGGRDGIAVSEIDVKYMGDTTWTRLDNVPAFSVGMGDNGSCAHFQAELSDGGAPLAVGATALRIVFGTQDNNGTGYVEIEADMPTVEDPRFVANLLVPADTSATWRGELAFVGADANTASIYVEYGPDAEHLTSSACLGSNIAEGASFELTLSGLTAETTYAYRLSATNSVGVAGTLPLEGTFTTASVLAGGRASADGDSISDGVVYTAHIFTQSGTFTPSEDVLVDLLVVGGGGAGGWTIAAGGGGGQVIITNSVPLRAGTTYAVIVGAGGNPQINGFEKAGGDGEPSSFGNIATALGGGGGAGWSSFTGRTGASGGGGANALDGHENAVGGEPISAATGHRGGNAAHRSAGGGGGAGGPGGNGVGADYMGNNGWAGDGGPGIACDYSGTTSYYGAGGGGGAGLNCSTPGVGGSGVGGNGSAKDSGLPGGDGTPGTGSGGGGGSYEPAIHGGNGGSGIVVVRYVNRQYAPTTPVAEVLPATAVAQTSATLRLRTLETGVGTAPFSYLCAWAPNAAALPDLATVGTGLAKGEILEVPVTGLLPGATYTVALRAIDANGVASETVTGTFETAADDSFLLPGLLQGTVSGVTGVDQTATLDDATDVRRVLGPVMAFTFGNPASTATYENDIDGETLVWGDYTMYIYTGRIWLEAGTTYGFGNDIDDAGYLTIDGFPILSQAGNTFQGRTYKSDYTGWHDIDIRVYNGNGGAGGNVGRFPAGFGYNTTGSTGSSDSWTRLKDPGDGSLLSVAADPGNLALAGGTRIGNTLTATLRHETAWQGLSLRAWTGATYGGSDPTAWDSATTSLGTIGGTGSVTLTFDVPAGTRYLRFYAEDTATGKPLLVSRTMLLDEFSEVTSDPIIMLSPVENAGVDSVALSVTVSNPGVGYETCDLYAIYAQVAGGAPHTNLLATGRGTGITTATLSGLYPNREYWVSVRAVNAGGGSYMTEPQTFQTSDLDEAAEGHFVGAESVPGLWQSFGANNVDPRTDANAVVIPAGAMITTCGSTASSASSSFAGPDGTLYTMGDRQAYDYSGYMHMEQGKTYSFAEFFDDSVTLLVDGTTVLNDGNPMIATYGTVTAAYTGWHSIEIHIWNGYSDWGVPENGGYFAVPLIGAGLAYSETASEVTAGNWTEWSPLTNTADRVFLRTEPIWRTVEVSGFAITGGALTATLALGGEDGQAHDLYVAYGASYGGASTSAWEHVERVGTVSADAVSFTDSGTVSGTYDTVHFARYFIAYDGDVAPSWSGTLVFGEAGLPSITGSLTIENDMGDGFTVAGSLGATGGSRCTVRVEVSSEPDLSGAVAWTALETDSPAAFTCIVHTNDTSSAAYITPGSTVYYRVVAENADGERDATAIASLTTPAAVALGPVSATTDLWTLTVKGSVTADGAGDAATVWLYTGASADSLAPTGDPIRLATLDAVQFQVTYPELGGTIYYAIVASNACETASWTIWSSIASIRLADQATYYWRGDVASGDWNDGANWEVEPADPRLVYPNDVGAVASFARRTAPTTVALPGSYTVKTLDFGAARASLTLAGSGTNTSALAAGSFAMQSGTSLEVASAQLVCRTLWEVPTGVRCLVRDAGELDVMTGGGEGIHFMRGDTRCELRGGSTLRSEGHVSTDGPDVRIVVDDSLFECGLYFVPARGPNATSNIVEFVGTAPRFTVRGALTPAWDNGGHDVTFLYHVPVGGYAEAPLQRSAVPSGENNKVMAGHNTHGAKVRVEVAADSPFFRAGTAGRDVPLVSWSVYGIATDYVDLTDQPRPAQTALRYETGNAGGDYPTEIWATLDGTGSTVVLLR